MGVDGRLPRNGAGITGDRARRRTPHRPAVVAGRTQYPADDLARDRSPAGRWPTRDLAPKGARPPRRTRRRHRPLVRPGQPVAGVLPRTVRSRAPDLPPPAGTPSRHRHRAHHRRRHRRAGRRRRPGQPYRHHPVARRTHRRRRPRARRLDRRRDHAEHSSPRPHRPARSSPTAAAEAERRAGVLEERSRLAREIHDTLAQGFVSIVLHLEAVEEAGPRTPTTPSDISTRPGRQHGQVWTRRVASSRICGRHSSRTSRSMTPSATGPYGGVMRSASTSAQKPPARLSHSPRTRR